MIKALNEDHDTEGALPFYHHELHGHEAAREQFMAWSRQRDNHAWLIGGARGIGKATFAIHGAHFLLQKDNAAWHKSKKDDPLWQRMLRGGHLDFFLLRPPPNKNKDKKTRQTITIDQLREHLRHLSLSHHESGKKLLVIDALEDMNHAARQTLLKTLEEPPPHCVILIISHFVGRALATIRSRCRLLMLRPLPQDAFAALMQQRHPDASLGTEELYRWSGASAGSAQHILAMKNNDILQEMWHALHEGKGSDDSSRKISGQWTKEPQAWHILMTMMDDFFHQQAQKVSSKNHDQFFDLWDQYKKMTRRAESLYLPKEQIIFLLLQKIQQWRAHDG